MSLKYRILPVTTFQQNCSLVWDEQTMEGALIDPGGDVEHLLALAKQAGVTLTRLLLTHGHIDHVGGALAIARQLGIPIEGPEEEDAFLLQRLPDQTNYFGFPHSDAFTPDRWLHDGMSVSVGGVELRVIHTPGHTPGHVVYFEPQTRTAFVGDVLFKGSIGRTDFPRGDYATLMSSITERLLPLGDDVTFVPGHGPISTFGNERRTNPFLTA
jgi:glyoxylase-like metal-dependent hydrolase (beta-lactamase superfamily II)